MPSLPAASVSEARSEDFNITPDLDGRPDTFGTFETSCQWYVMGLKPTERGQAAAGVWRRLKSAPRQVLQHLNPKDFQGEDSIDKLLVILKQSPLQTMALPDAFQKLESYHHLRRQPKEMVANLIAREQDAFEEVSKALKRVRDESRHQGEPLQLLRKKAKIH